MNDSASRTWPALRSALLFGALGAGVLSLGLGLTYRVLERENRAFVQQSIGDTASILAVQVKLEMERLTNSLTELGQERLKPILIRQELELRERASVLASNSVTAPPSATPVSPVGANSIATLEAAQEIADVSIWKKSELGTLANRALLAVNSRSRIVTPQWIPEIQRREESERKWIEPAFKGHRVLLVNHSSNPSLHSAPMALLAVPLGHGEVNEVVVAHVSLVKVQEIFSNDRFVQAFLTDGEGEPLAQDHSMSQGEPLSRESLTKALAPILEKIRLGQQETGLESMEESTGTTFFGGFRRIGMGKLAVVALVPPGSGDEALRGVRAQLLIFVSLLFSGLASGRFWFLTRPRSSSAIAAQENAGSAEAPLASTPLENPARSGVFASIHGSLRGFNQLLESQGAEETAEALNDYLTLAATRVRGSGGHFDSTSGVSFVASWEVTAQMTGVTEIGMECAFALIADLAMLNESRKVDGKRKLTQGLGMHIGRAMAANLGPANGMRASVAGEAPACARALDRLALAAGCEFVVSEEIVKAMGSAFQGTSLGESRLTGETGLSRFYAVKGARLESNPGLQDSTRATSGETRVQILAPAFVEAKWLVNNGTQIVGPFTARELAHRLFAQDLDFDCECWDEETGTSSVIRLAGIFTGTTSTNEADAQYWVFDGQTVHGPVSEGFLRTALSRAALTEKAFVCSGSTIEGWKPIVDFLRLIEARSSAESSAAALNKQRGDSGPAAA